MKKTSKKKEEEEKELAKKIADIVSSARIEAGFTQDELAKKVGTSQPNIARIESGRYWGPTSATLRKIARALGLELRIELKPVAKNK